MDKKKSTSLTLICDSKMRWTFSWRTSRFVLESSLTVFQCLKIQFFSLYSRYNWNCARASEEIACCHPTDSTWWTTLQPLDLQLAGQAQKTGRLSLQDKKSKWNKEDQVVTQTTWFKKKKRWQNLHDIWVTHKTEEQQRVSAAASQVSDEWMTPLPQNSLQSRRHILEKAAFPLSVLRFDPRLSTDASLRHRKLCKSLRKGNAISPLMHIMCCTNCCPSSHGSFSFRPDFLSSGQHWVYITGKKNKKSIEVWARWSHFEWAEKQCSSAESWKTHLPVNMT